MSDRFGRAAAGREVPVPALLLVAVHRAEVDEREALRLHDLMSPLKVRLQITGAGVGG